MEGFHKSAGSWIHATLYQTEHDFKEAYISRLTALPTQVTIANTAHIHICGYLCISTDVGNKSPAVDLHLVYLPHIIDLATLLGLTDKSCGNSF